jgi:two-component system sensor histidine kinase BaeS
VDIHYQPGEDRQLNVDGEKIVTIITNILTNCLKYGHSRVEITTNVNRGDLWYTICIKDDGNGFNENDLRHIFDRFYKGSKAGTGLGMAIASSIAERHQGELKAMNAPEGGAQFILRLPLSAAQTMLLD